VEPPVFPAEFVRRPRLVQRLAAAGESRLALIVAPPGYGKSSLLSEWAEFDEREFLWLDMEDDAGEDAGADSVPELIESAATSYERFVLVLDDADLLPARMLRELVGGALAQLPRECTLALGARTSVALAVGRLRANRALVELHTPDLALTTSESAVLLRRAGLELDFKTVQSLVRRTEGWPAALYLAGTSLRQQPELFAGVAHFSGGDHLIGEYLRDEVLSRLSPELSRFALMSSALDQLSGPVCDAALDRDESAVALRKLARACPLLVPLDPEHDQYRWHRLFRETLHRELRQLDSECATHIHQRASDWYADNHHDERAIHHAIAAREVERAGELLLPELPTLVLGGKCGLVAEWLASLSPAEISSSAPLALAAAYSSLVSGEVPAAQRWALVAEGARHETGGSNSEGITTGLALIEAAVARGGVAQMGDAAARAGELEPDGGPWRPLACLLQAVSLHLAGDREPAARLLEDGVDRGAVITPAVAAACLAQRAIIAIEQNAWDAADEFASGAERLLCECGLDRHPTSALVAAASAAARAHQGRADEAKRDLRRARDLLVSLGDFLPWYGAEARILLAHASLWIADVVGARTLLAEASRLARRVVGASMFEHWFDDAWGHLDTLAEARLAGTSSLTIAELRVLRFLPSHRSFREIASQLGVSGNTVKTQAHAIYRKLGVASRSEAVARAIEAGMLLDQ
jgi:LuxR family maltose regulon positive regulatory protein